MGGISAGAIIDQMYRPQSPQYDPYTAARRPSYTPFGPSGQFYQPIYQPSYSQPQFNPFAYSQPQFNNFYQSQMPTFSRPMMPPMQRQSYSIPYMNMSQFEAKQAAAAPPQNIYDSGGGDGGFGGPGDSGGAVGGDGASASDSGGSVGADGAGASGAGPGDGPGGYNSGGAVPMFKQSLVAGGRVRKQSYGGIDALLKK
jgi:hypothetical protein